MNFSRGVSCYSRPVVQGSSSTVTLHMSNTKNPQLTHATCAWCIHTPIAFHTVVVRHVVEENKKTRLKGTVVQGGGK